MTGVHLSDKRVSLEVDGAIATVTINRPDKLNAVDPTMLDAIAGAFAAIDQSNDLRVAVLSAAGEKSFCVGADITAWSALEPLDMWRRWVKDGHAALDVISRTRQPVIAAINGLALGGGLELALACDIRICAEHARFGSPEVRIGTVPGWGGTRRLVDAIGAARAKHLVFTGDQIDAATALSWGLVSEAVAAAELHERVQQLAATIAVNAPVAVQLAKSIMTHGSTGSANLAMETLAGALAASTEDGREGVQSFREKRPPEYLGR
ncbi:enoyl-CoA hydratase/isomerase family protein [soil metagenome]